MEGAWLRHYSWRCQPVDFSNTAQALRVTIDNDYLNFLIEFIRMPFYFKIQFKS